MERVINTFLIGADPEFAVVDTKTGSAVNVRSYGLENGFGQFGHDHGGAVVELRPTPSYTVSGLIGNIKRLLESHAGDQIREFKWRSGAYFAGHGMGGHIHLELPSKGRHGVKDAVFDARLAACDRVTQELEFHNIFPKEECARRRTESGYGGFGNYQEAMSNGITRTEYRTPCSWLYDPKCAFLILTGIKLAAANPQFALDNITGVGDPKVRWTALVKFFRAFRKLDQDAEYVCRNLIPTVHEKFQLDLAAKPDQDFKELWAKFSA